MPTNKKVVKMYNDKVIIEFFPDSHRYKKQGEKQYIPSVTTITGIIDKSRQLIYWAVNLTKNYLLDKYNSGETIDIETIYEACDQYNKKRDDAASIGTQVHDWAEKFSIAIRNSEPIPEINKDFDDRVVMGINGFLDWVEESKVKFIEAEKLVYSEKYNYCGLADAIVEINGKKILVDYKTGKDIYSGMHYQVSAYVNAYNEEHEDKIQSAIIVHFNKETGVFKKKEISGKEVLLNMETFVSCLNIINREKQLKLEA